MVDSGEPFPDAPNREPDLVEILAHPDDIEAAFTAYQTIMFARSEEEAVAAHGAIDLIFGAHAPIGLANLFNGSDEDAE